MFAAASGCMYSQDLSGNFVQYPQSSGPVRSTSVLPNIAGPSVPPELLSVPLPGSSSEAPLPAVPSSSSAHSIPSGRFSTVPFLSETVPVNLSIPKPPSPPLAAPEEARVSANPSHPPSRPLKKQRCFKSRPTHIMLRLEADLQWGADRVLVGCIKGRNYSAFRLKAWATEIWGQHLAADIPFVYTFVRGWFALRFGNADHTRWVLSSSWRFENDLVLLKRWTPLFDPETEQIGVGPVWIRLPGLPLQYWSEDVFSQIGNFLGTFMEFDKSYQTTGMMQYARILVHLDTREDLQGFITIQWRSFSRKQRLDYEGIPHRCRKCDQVGHLFKACPLLKKLKQAKQEQEQELPAEQPPPQAEKLKRAEQEQEQELPAEQPPPQAEKLKRAKQEQEQELPAEQPPPQAEKLKQVKQEQELPAEQPPPQAAETSERNKTRHQTQWKRQDIRQNKTSDTVEAPPAPALKKRGK